MARGRGRAFVGSGTGDGFEVVRLIAIVNRTASDRKYVPAPDLADRIRLAHRGPRSGVRGPFSLNRSVFCVLTLTTAPARDPMPIGSRIRVGPRDQGSQTERATSNNGTRYTPRVRSVQTTV